MSRLSHVSSAVRRASLWNRWQEWTGFALIPVALLVALALGEALIHVLGYPAGGPEPSPLVKVGLGSPVILLTAGSIALAIVGLHWLRNGKHP